MPDVLLYNFYVKKNENIQKLAASSPEPPTCHSVRPSVCPWTMKVVGSAMGLHSNLDVKGRVPSATHHCTCEQEDDRSEGVFKKL